MENNEEEKKNNVSYYAIIPGNVRYDKDLCASAKLLYGEITSLCNQKGICWATNSYFASLYKVSNETVSRWVSLLRKKGYINVKLFYKKDSKEVDKRIISIAVENILNLPIDENINTYCQNSQTNIPIDKNINTYCQNNQAPIDKKLKEKNKNRIIKNKKIYSQVINYLNEKIGTKFKSSTDYTQRLIDARLNEGFKLNDFKTVIDIKTAQWLNDKVMNIYLRPSTLFSNKFEAYLNERKFDLQNNDSRKDNLIDVELQSRRLSNE